MNKLKTASWNVINQDVVLKTVDLKMLVSNRINVPVELEPYFDSFEERLVEKELIFLYGNREFLVTYEYSYDQSVLSFKQDFRILLRENCHNYFELLTNDKKIDKSLCPKIRLKKVGNSIYEMQLIDMELLNDSKDYYSDEVLILEESQLYKSMKQYNLSKKRVKSILEYHGLDCSLCGFSFVKTYGAMAINCISIYPNLDVTNGNINKRYIPICSNCKTALNNSKVSLDSLRARLN